MNRSCFIYVEDKEDVLIWCQHILPQYGIKTRRWQWFPFFRVNSREAVRFDIYFPDDLLIFKLAWSSKIAKS